MINKSTCSVINDIFVGIKCQMIQSKFLFLILTLLENYFTGEGHDFVVELKAVKEKLMKEKLSVTDSTNPELVLKMTLHARVLGTKTCFII